MDNDMPPLVHAHGAPGGRFGDGGWNIPSSPPLLAHPSAGATPWHPPSVLPGGFGAGTPHSHAQQRRLHATPTRTHRSLSVGHGHAHGRNMINPFSAPQQMPGADPFSMPAAAFDQHHFPPGSFGHSPSPGPLQMSMPSPWHASSPHTHQQDPEDGLGNGFGTGSPDFSRYDPWASPAAFGHHSPGSGSSSGKGPSPSASVINGFVSGPRSQYKRPDNWRRDFSMSRPGALTRVFSFGKGSKSGGLFSKPTLHKILDARERSCSWDIRRPPEQFLVLPEQRRLEFLDLREGAMKPEPVRMKIMHPRLPWAIHVDAGNPGFRQVITIGHLIDSIYRALMTPVYEGDFWNEDVSEEDRRKIHDAWASRCAGDRELAQQGIKRVDFLCDLWVFEGLRRMGDAWEMKLKSGRRLM